MIKKHLKSVNWKIKNRIQNDSAIFMRREVSNNIETFVNINLSIDNMFIILRANITVPIVQEIRRKIKEEKTYG